MKKTTKIIALVLALMVVLCSCGSAGSFSEGLDENGRLKGITATDYVEIGNVDSIKLAKSDIESTITLLTDYYFPAEKEIYDRAILETDDVNIDYVGSVDGVEFEGGSTKGSGTVVDIDQTSYIDDFMEQLVGHNPGETFDVNVTFPDDYDNTDLAGKDAVFVTTINYIVEYEPAEYNDDFVKNNAYYIYQMTGAYVSTTAELEEALQVGLMQSYVLGECKMKEDAEIPDEVQQHINKTILLSIKETAEKSAGVELSTYLKQQYDVDSEEAFLEKYAEDLKTEAQTVLVTQALTEHYGVEVSEDDVKAYFDDEDENTISYEEAKKIYGLPYLKQFMSEEKMWEYAQSVTTVE